eukprot:1231429-Lingulodinium_polyedra.AAC.1
MRAALHATLRAALLLHTAREALHAQSCTRGAAPTALRAKHCARNALRVALRARAAQCAALRA